MKTGITALVLMLNILPSGAFAATVVVGPRGCHQGSPHFSTIQAAVNAAPGGNVLVCPGTYPEQVVISTPLVLKGVSYKNSSAATITPPSGGMVANTQTSSWLYSNNGVSSVAAQISVQNTHDVAISNVAIDGGSTANCSTFGTGIDLYNSGITSHPVSVSNVVVRNTCGIGILSDSSLSTIQASDVYNTGWSGIFVVEGSYLPIQVLHNTVMPSPNNYGLEFSGGNGAPANSTLVSQNTVFGGAYFQVYGGVKFSNNTMSGAAWNHQIYLEESGGNSILNNSVNGDIYTCGDPCGQYSVGSGSNMISGNQVIGGIRWFSENSDTIQYNTTIGSAIGGDDWIDGAGGNTVRYNAIMNSACGVSIANNNQSTAYSNTFIGVTQNTC